MPGNPRIPQGTLNRLKANVIWPAFPGLNVSASYLGRAGIRLALEGQSTAFYPTMTGAVTSPEPYMMINLSMNLLKTQPLGAAYKAQMELSALIGDGTIFPDLPLGESGITTYSVVNCAIESVRELSFAGDDPSYNVAIRGYYLVNSSLWD